MAVTNAQKATAILGTLEGYGVELKASQFKALNKVILNLLAHGKSDDFVANYVATRGFIKKQLTALSKDFGLGDDNGDGKLSKEELTQLTTDLKTDLKTASTTGSVVGDNSTPTITYGITGDKSSATEGLDTVTYTVTGEAGKTYTWTVDDNHVNDVVTAAGTVVIGANGTGTFTVAAKQDNTTESAEVLKVSILDEAAVTVASTNLIIQEDAGLAVTALAVSATSITEGQTGATFSVTGGTANATYTWTVDSARTADVEVAGGTITLDANGAGSFTVTAKQDSTTEAAEVTTVSLLDSNGVVVATRSVTIVEDPNIGQTFTLTTGVDTGVAFTGGAGNDNYLATSAYITGTSTQKNTLSDLDSLNGGDGTDTLTISNDSGAYTLATGITLNNIEKVNVTSSGSATVDLTPSSITGVTELNVTQSAAATLTAGTSTAVKVSGATGAVTVTGGSTQTVTVEQGANAVALTKGTDVSVTASKVTTGTITIGAGGATNEPSGTVTIQSAGKTFADAATSTLGTITVNGGTSVTINQDAYSDVTAAATATAAAKTITQSDVTVNGGANTTTVSVTQDAAATGVSAVKAVAGTTESASVTFSSMKSGQHLSAGGLTFTATKDLTASEVATAFASLTKNDTLGSAGSANGYYSGTLSGWTSGAASGSSVTFTSTTIGSTTAANVTDLAFTGTAQSAPVAPAVAPIVTITQGVNTVTEVTGVAGVVGGAVTVNGNITGADKITTVTLDGYGAVSTVLSDALTTLSLANSNQDVTVTNTTAASTLGLTTNHLGTVAVAAVYDSNAVLTKAAVAEVAATVSLDGSPGTYTTLNLTTAGTDSVVALTATGVKTLNVAGTNAVKITTDLTALETVVVSGSAGVDLSAVSAAGYVSINTTATTGTVTSLIDTTTTYAGGAGVDNITVGATTKALTLGAGDDTAVMSVAVGTGGSVDAGEGTADKLKLTAVNAVARSADAAFEAGISNFEVLEISDALATAAASVNLANLDDINNVIINGATATATIDKFGANGSLTIKGAITDAVEAKLADATGTADVFNITVSNAGSLSNTGALTVAGVETINITSTDSAPTDATASSHTLTLIDTKATTINVTGNAALNLTNDATNVAVTLIDGSTMTGALTATTTNTTAAETIKGGSGNDTLTSTGNFANVLNGGAGNDTLKSGAGLDSLTGGDGADVFIVDSASLNVNSAATITDFTNGTDEIRFVDANNFVASKITLDTTAVFQDYANAAMVKSGLNELTWFQYGGNTYIMMDAGTDSTTSFVNGTDKVVKLNGLVDLSTMAFNNTTGSLNGTVAATLLTSIDLTTPAPATVNASAVTGITGTYAEIKAAYDANTAGTITGLGDEATTLSDTTLTLANLATYDSLTTGLATATTVTTTSGSVADGATVFGNEGTSGNKIDLNAAVAVTLSDAALTAVTAADLSTIGGATTGTVTVTNAVDITGTEAQNTAALVTAASKVVAATATVAVTDATVTAAGIAAIDAVTTGLVTATGSTTVTGTATEVAAYATAETANTAIGSDAAYGATISGTDMTVAQANVIDAANGAGVITGTIVNTSTVASLKTLTNTDATNAYTITIPAGDATSAAADLSTINGITSVAVGATAVTKVTGTVAQLVTLAGEDTATTITMAANYAVEASDATITGADLNTIDGENGTGTITTTNVGGWTITGLNGLTVAGTGSDDKFQLVNTDTGVTISSFTQASDIAQLGGTNAAVAATVAAPGADVVNRLVFDTDANLGALGVSIGDLSADVNDIHWAVASDTGAIYFDADGNWTAGSVQIGTVGVVVGLAATNFTVG